MSKAKKLRRADKPRTAEEVPSLDLFSGDFIRLHVLHHASEQPVYGLWLIEELAEHGYRVSPGTLYPLLHSLEQSELLKSYNEVYEGKVRRYYRITVSGRRQLKKAKCQLLELMGEILTKDEVDRLGNLSTNVAFPSFSMLPQPRTKTSPPQLPTSLPVIRTRPQ